MKKTIQLVVLTLILLLGGISNSMAEREIIYRSQICTEGETFHVSFINIFDGRTEEVILISQTGYGREEIELGVVSAHGQVGVTIEDQGEYWFGCYTQDEHGFPYFEYRLCVILTVVRPTAQWMNDLTKDNHCNSLVCIQEKKVVWNSKILVLA